MQAAVCVLTGLALSGIAIAQKPLYLKTRTVNTAIYDGRIGSWQVERVESAHFGRDTHLLIQTTVRPDREVIARLASSGLRTLAYVPDDGLLVSARYDADLAPIQSAGIIRWAGIIRGSDKIQEARLGLTLDVSTPRHFIVEFYRDVDLTEARVLLTNAGTVLRENPDLFRYQFLVAATPQQIRTIADADIVSYIYPAIPELVAGIPVVACAWPTTEIAPLAAIAATSIGRGSDGRAKAKASFGYYFGELTARLPDAEIKHEFVKALTEWTRHAKINFAETNTPGLGMSVDLSFHSRNHNDPFPFDGSGGVMAHAFFPAPQNTEPLGGDIHFDDDEPWSNGGLIDFYSTAIHEIGHSLGIGHINVSGAVMYPFYRRIQQLGQPDIDALQTLYEKGTGSVTPNGPGRLFDGDLPPSPRRKPTQE